MYVIVRTDGKFVTPPGSERSYTTSLQKARIYPTFAAADGDRCPENETVRAVADLLQSR